jgi:hypothetical protein
MESTVKKFFTSRKFVIAVAYGLLVTANMVFSLNLSTEALLGAAGVVATYIAAEAAVDAKRTN